ncbi:hypothetical protein JVT61DRAFT_11354 [Boletus reticuloceps]|uniref:F-box domain-containing protein n=1 Tax=Boletus reticuloceps TaxID=495285 RepID=A0A8I2YES3_9AGAM|nr:hypothetical protein JVT61DRAFT_11354 [Boletus reticuloceps]
MAPPLTKVKKSSPPTVRLTPRRAHLVDTNTLSYNRTDPFHAIITLRRLISSLSSRIGGCQYKFTPDEHKLSLHLLTIVEPFVGLSPSGRTLTRQPTEILDAIVSHVDSKRDLLSLALSCHRLHAVIFPRHYYYRVVCAKASSLCLWSHLVVNRALAHNVRTLEIVDERSSKSLVLPPDIMNTDTDVESSDDELVLHSKQERLLTSALTKMTGLRSFRWSCNHSMISMDNVWAALMKCQTLSQVTISDNVVFLPYTPDKPKPASPKSVPVLPDLKTVALQATKHSFGSTKTPALARISGMLTSCPNIESLDIEYEHRRGRGQHLPVADDFFLCSRWPALRSLSLANLRCFAAHTLESASIFLAAHANLEVLHLDFPLDRPTTGTGSGIVTAPGLILSQNALPKLRELRCNKTIATAILSCPTNSPRPLEVLKGITLSGVDWDSAFFASLRRCKGTVRRIELAGWNDLDDIKRLVDCVPRLTWLEVNKHRRAHESTEQAPRSRAARRNEMSSGMVAAAHNAGLGVATNVTEWATVLSSLTELTTFIGVKFFYEVSTLTLATLATSSPMSLSASEFSRVRKNDQVAGVLGNKCPRLRRLDHWEESGGRVIVLSRDGNEVKWEVKRLKV